MGLLGCLVIFLSSLLELTLLIIVIVYECYILQRFTTMESDNSGVNAEGNQISYDKDAIEEVTLEENETIDDNKLNSAALNLVNLDSTTLNLVNLDNTTLNLVNLDSTTLNFVNLDSSTINESLKHAAVEEINDDNEGIPAPRNVIKIPDLLSNGKMSKVYEVNGSTFVENDNLSIHDNDTLAHYELYKVMKVDEHEDGNEDEDMTTELDIHVQTLPQGVIINSNVFLWDMHWHTMALVDGNVFCCAVCRVYCDRATLKSHVETVSHRQNLEEYKPLKRFDLSIVRKIHENFHCGVCNEIFDIIDYKTHENSKNHEGNLLTAINKVSDLMYDSNLQRSITTEKVHSAQRTIEDYGRNPQSYGSITQSYGRNTVSYGRNTQSDGRNTQSDGRNTQSDGRNTQSDGRNTQSYGRNTQSDGRNVTPDAEVKNDYNDFNFDANVVDNNNLQVYEEFCESEEETEYICETEEYNTPFEGVSYASMASKPTMELPKFLKIDLGTKEVRVKFESWHMVIKIELNKFYCMVCNKQDHIRFKSQHCISCAHVERLAKCTVVKAFEDYLIRKVGDKLYHCGHCNNLQYQNQMMDHIEIIHPKINKNIIDTTQPNSPLKITKKTAKNIDKNVTSKTERVDVEPKNETESEKSAIRKTEVKFDTRIDNFDIFGDVTISPFGTALKISALAFNFIMKKGEGYYCAICDKACVDVKVHVGEFDHMEAMVMTPFIRPFKCNLTRAVRGTLHCSLCNELLSVNEMFTHNMDPPHTTALATALGMRRTSKPEASAKKNDINKPNQKIDQNLSVKSPSNQSVDKTETPQLNPKLPSPASNPQTGNKDHPDDVLKISEHSTGNTASSKDNSNVKVDVSQSSNNLNLGPNGTQLLNAGINFNLPNSGDNFPVPGPNLPFPGQNLNPGQSFQNYPSMYNAMLPILQSKNIDQYLRAPMNYGNFAPMAPYPFPYVSGAPLSPNLNNFNNSANQSDITSNNNLKATKNQNLVGNKTTDKAQAKKNVSANGQENIKSGNEIIRSGDEIIKSGDEIIKSGDEIIKSGDEIIKVDDDIASNNVTIESLVSQSDDDDFKELDEEELVFVKLKTAYFKITNLSYNSLIYMDNGIRHCFVCSSTIGTNVLRRHVESREHTENISKAKFLDKYGVQLFRQMYLMYHCAICNVLMSRKEIKHHLDWSDHIESYDLAHVIVNKKNRKKLISGIKECVVETQKEAIFNNVNEPRINLVDAYHIVPNMDGNKDGGETKPAEGSKPTVTKKNKMVIINNVVMKVGFDHWHGIISAKNVTKCILCQVEIRPNEIMEHVQTDYHSVALGKTFEKAYYPDLIRKINENTVNCMICNLELPNNEGMVHEHATGRRHRKYHESVVNETCNSDSYADCYEDYLTL